MADGKSPKGKQEKKLTTSGDSRQERSLVEVDNPDDALDKQERRRMPAGDEDTLAIVDNPDDAEVVERD